MELRRIFVSAVLAGCLVSSGICQLQNASAPTQTVCADMKKAPVPAGDQPDSAQLKQMAGCDSKKLYYGIGEKADFIAARMCAYVQRANGSGVVFGGPAILMMLYANGDGVSRNYTLAEKFACEAGGAPAEIDGRIEHLEKLRQQHWTGKNFDLCDDITSGHMAGYCTLLQSQMQAAKRESRLDAIVDAWSTAERQAFQPLQAASNRFINTRAEKEVDQSGTAGASFVIAEKTSLQNRFFAALQTLQHGKLPRYSPEDLRRADAELNAVFAKAEKPSTLRGTVTPRGIRQTEWAWIQYRDAWVTFGALKYPGVSADSWKTWLTKERIAMLQKLTPPN